VIPALSSCSSADTPRKCSHILLAPICLWWPPALHLQAHAQHIFLPSCTLDWELEDDSSGGVHGLGVDDALGQPPHSELLQSPGHMAQALQAAGPGPTAQCQPVHHPPAAGLYDACLCVSAYGGALAGINRNNGKCSARCCCLCVLGWLLYAGAYLETEHRHHAGYPPSEHHPGHYRVCGRVLGECCCLTAGCALTHWLPVPCSGRCL